MTNNSFFLARRYYVHRDKIHHLIEKYQGMYQMNATNDGEVYRIQFDEALQSDNFRREIRLLIPGVYGY